MSALHVSTHPLIKHFLRDLRDRSSSPELFRRSLQIMTQILFIEASQDLPTQETKVQTPLAWAKAEVVSERWALVPILRAGLGMAEALRALFPPVITWHLGLFRDHNTKEPVTYYNKLPQTETVSRAFVLDPMLATGGSAVAALNLLKEADVPALTFLALIGAPEGVKRVQESHPDVDLYLAALDEKLDSNSYIVPGLGDAGDRQFAT